MILPKRGLLFSTRCVTLLRHGCADGTLGQAVAGTEVKQVKGATQATQRLLCETTWLNRASTNGER